MNEMRPMLLHKCCLFWHFQKLTEVPIDKLNTTYEVKINKILIYGEWKFNLPISLVSKQEIRGLTTIEIITRHFNENSTNFIQIVTINFQILLYLITEKLVYCCKFFDSNLHMNEILVLKLI